METKGKLTLVGAMKACVDGNVCEFKAPNHILVRIKFDPDDSCFLYKVENDKWDWLANLNAHEILWIGSANDWRIVREPKFKAGDLVFYIQNKSDTPVFIKNVMIKYSNLLIIAITRVM